MTLAALHQDLDTGIGRKFAPPTVVPHAPRILLYAPDTSSLGGLRRTLLLAETLADEYPKSAVLIVSESSAIHSLGIPAGVDYVELPSGGWEADSSDGTVVCDGVLDYARSAVLLRAVLGFDPDLFIADGDPVNLGGELADVLEALKARGRAKRVLAMRDVLDEPARTRNALERPGTFESMERCYDEVWIYGLERVFDAAREYGFPTSLTHKVRYCGYLVRPHKPSPPSFGPLRVAVAAEARDLSLVQTYLEGLVGLQVGPTPRTTIFLGPEASLRGGRELIQRFSHLANIEFCDFDPVPMLRYAEADVVVARAGYETVCELLALGTPAIVVPRSTPDQRIRAGRLAALRCFDIVEPEELGPEILIRRVLDALETARTPARPFELDGLGCVLERTRALLQPD